MDEQDMQGHLYDLFAAMTMADFTDAQEIAVPCELLDNREGIDWVSTFSESGVLTNNAGIVVRMKDGREFQISIVRSR